MNSPGSPASVSSGKPLIRALQGEALKTPPIWLMRQAGRYLPEYRALRETVGGFLDLCLTPELAAEVTLQPVRRYPLDAAILFSDILIVPYALGQALEYREGEGPVLEPVRSVLDVASLSDSDFRDRIAPVWRTVERVKDGLGPDISLIGFAGAPWTVASYMVEGSGSRDFAAVKSFAFADPSGFGSLIDRLVDATAIYLDGQIRAGAEVIQLFDSWAGILPEAQFRQWVIAPTKKIVAALRRDHPSVPIIGFPRGAGLMFTAYFAETGVTALGLDQMVPLTIARTMLQPLGAVQGNLDPLLLVQGGPAMEQAANDILTALGHGPFIFNLGHGVLPNTPPEHVQALIDLVHRHKNS
ncbi:MAG TPA: uroporphyrinogen decarboxylase [Stellaceae bacterium]|jgi:uroporphyrinogen decarboxylase